MFELNQSREQDCNTIIEWDCIAKMPMLLYMKGMQSNAVLHSIGIYNGQIIDGSFLKSIKLTQRNLDFAMGDNDRVLNVLRVFILDPHHTKKTFIWDELHVSHNSTMYHG